MRRLKLWWGKLSTNEKMMYPLAALLLIGIISRWRYIFKEIGEAFTVLFQ